MPTTVALRIRPASVRDDPAIAEIVTHTYADDPPTSAEEIAWGRKRADPDRPSANLVAELDGRVVGIVFLFGHSSWPGLKLALQVEPAQRRRGIGTRLFEAALVEVGETVHPIWTTIAESDADSLRFATRRGFVERDRTFELTLDLETFDPDAFEAPAAAALARGLRLAAFSDVDSPQLRHQLHELTVELDRDVPSAAQLRATTYEEWVGTWLASPYARPGLVAIAFDGDMPIAVSSIIVARDGTAYNELTGVRAAHRGQGLGLAVKIEALRLAKAAGVREVRTSNHQANAPMIAINARLGYRQLPAYVELVRHPGAPREGSAPHS
jgi:GNAT superfamily N-acetyltransferase